MEESSRSLVFPHPQSFYFISSQWAIRSKSGWEGQGMGRKGTPPNSAGPPSISRGPSCTTGLWTLLPFDPIILLPLVAGDTGQDIRWRHWAEVVFSYSKT